jgi:hypothetical protein
MLAQSATLTFFFLLAIQANFFVPILLGITKQVKPTCVGCMKRHGLLVTLGPHAESVKFCEPYGSFLQGAR